MPVLNVPLIGQWGFYANARRNDCGASCVAMCLEFFGKRGTLTVDQLALETPLAAHDSGLYPIHLVRLATKHGLACHVHLGTTEDELRAEILAGRPVIALIAYRYITNRLDVADNVPGLDGHYVTIIGFDPDDGHWIIDDPDVWAAYTERGHNMQIAVTDLRKAMSAYAGQCVFMERALTAKQQIIDLLNQALLKAQDLPDEQPVPTPPPPPTPSPVISRRYVVPTDGLRAHLEPKLASGFAKTSIPYAALINVSDTGITESGHRWWKVFDGTWANLYVAGEFLSATLPNL